MKVSGFTFVRNVVKYDYPVVESIRSILPVVYEFIVNGPILSAPGRPPQSLVESPVFSGSPSSRASWVT
jgi:hypothetical protein